MAMTTASQQTDWRQEWFEIEDATYLNLAGESPMPKVAIRAVQAALESKKNPHHKADSTFFEVPNRIRASLAKLIGGKPEEIAVTSGASAGEAAVAYALTWMPRALPMRAINRERCFCWMPANPVARFPWM